MANYCCPEDDSVTNRSGRRAKTVLSKLSVDRCLTNPQYAGSGDFISFSFLQHLHNGVAFHRIEPLCVLLLGENIVSGPSGN